jgi:hypothetical protein
MVSKGWSVGVIFACVNTVGGCGTMVPNIQEFWGDAADAAHMEAKVAAQVQCELSQAVRYLFGSSARSQIEFIRSWNAQIALTFSVSEKSSFDPQVNFTEILPSAISHFSRGRTVSTRRVSLLASVFLIPMRRPEQTSSSQHTKSKTS